MTRAIILCLLLAVSATAQNAGKISGRVVDAKTQQPLPFANIVIRGTLMGASSDLEGSFFILNVPPGVYDVAASMIGYRGVVQEKVIVNINRTTVLDFSLEETVVQGQEVVVMAKRPDVEREKSSTSEIRRAEEVMNVPGIQDISDVLKLSSDISDGHFRGGRANEELYNLHGMGIMNPLDGSNAFTPIMSAVEEVEVITSGFGVQYGNAQSGIVNITMKEGSSDKWTARGEMRMRVPGLKHFGPGLWDTTANPYLKMLDSPAAWLDTTDANRDMSFIQTVYGTDKIAQAQLGYALYHMQMHRDFLKTYDNLQDYSTDVNFGGPLSNNVRFFAAVHLDKNWPLLPTAEPDVNRQFMGNLVYDFTKGMSLRLSGAASKNEVHNLSGRSTSGWINWVWDRIIPVMLTENDNIQFGLRWAHALSERTFYEIKLNTLQTTSLVGSPITSPDYLQRQGLQLPFWVSTWLPDPDGFTALGKATGTFRNDYTRTISLDASITSQVTGSHMLMGGIQGNWYIIDVNDQSGVDSRGGGNVSSYVAKPFEVGLYIQDKMEFEGMIANIGLRLDMYNPNTSYYTNIFAPFFYTDTSGGNYFEPLAPRAQSSTVVRLQPRVGFSFPVSVNTVFHMNYGTFLQRPTFSQILSHTFGRLDLYNRGGATSVPSTQIMGNPQLKPQITNSYDVGVTQGFGDGFTLDVSGYFKDIKNLVQQAQYFPSNSSNLPYMSYVNLDYASIRGFRMGLARRVGMLTGTLSYTYGVAIGKRSNSDASNYPTIFESGQTSEPLPQDVFLDFDRTHNVIANFGFNAPQNWGPMIFDVYPLDQLTIAVTSFLRSGRPYTSWIDRTTAMNKRAPNEATTNVRISKKVPTSAGSNAIVYFEIANLFNDRIYDYNAVFSPDPLNTSNLQRFTVRYENGQDITYYDNQNHPDFLANQEFRIFSNPPRSWTLGIVVNF